MILYCLIEIEYKNKVYKDYNGPISIEQNSFNEINETIAKEYINKYILYYFDMYKKCAMKNIKGLNVFTFNKNNIKIHITCDYISNTSYKSGYCNVLTYVYDYFNDYILRFINDGNNLYRAELSDKNNIQYLYPIGSKVKLKFPIDYNITEGIIVSNEEEYINDDDFSNTYKIKVKNKHGEYISLFYPHYMDILESDKNPYKIIKGGKVYEQK